MQTRTAIWTWNKVYRNITEHFDDEFWELHLSTDMQRSRSLERKICKMMHGLHRPSTRHTQDTTTHDQCAEQINRSGFRTLITPCSRISNPATFHLHFSWGLSALIYFLNLCLFNEAYSSEYILIIHEIKAEGTCFIETSFPRVC